MIEPNTHFLTIDPGLTGTGWAIFHSPNPMPKIWGVVIPKGDIDKKIETVTNTLTSAISAYVQSLGKYGFITYGYIEIPITMMGSAKGIASTMKGDIIKLSQLCGAISASLYQAGLIVKRISPTDWKGQLPKDVMEYRIGKRFPGINFPHHTMDAIGMGLWIMEGKF